MKNRPKEILKKLKDEKNQRRNVTFTVNFGLKEDFREICESEEISMNQVIEALMRDFVDQYNEDNPHKS